MGEILNLPVYHLDRLYWKPNWVSTSSDEWESILGKILAEPEWIMDGNYGATMDLRLAACDTVVFLDLPRWLCVWRVMKRFLTYRCRCRPDMTEGCEEKLDLTFFLWIWRYRKDKRPQILAKLARLEKEKSVHILESRLMVRKFLESLTVTNQSD
ncbi:MAG: topology modulation protein [Verrucomicrobiales bacterium]